MLKPLHILEDKLAALLDFVRQLQESNRQLREQVSSLQSEKSVLQTRMGQAQTRIDQIIEQLSAAPSEPLADDTNADELAPNPIDTHATEA